jgi:transcriptional regulator with XRE-family HTH domain
VLHLKLRELREFNKYTQAEVAERLGVSRVAYGLHERGERQMSYEALSTIADLYKVSTDYLLGREATDMTILNDSEKQMIAKFRGLDVRGQETVQVLIDYEADR